MVERGAQDRLLERSEFSCERSFPGWAFQPSECCVRRGGRTGAPGHVLPFAKHSMTGSNMRMADMSAASHFAKLDPLPLARPSQALRICVIGHQHIGMDKAASCFGHLAQILRLQMRIPTQHA